MFCPNCGKDCGNNRFCVSCGTRIQPEAVQESRKTEWKAGMPCPHCGGTKLTDNCCAFCGAQLVFDAPNNPDVQEDSFDLPLIDFGFGGEIELNENSLTYRSFSLFSRGKVYEIQYAQIGKVEYVRCGRSNDGLTITDHADAVRSTRILDSNDDARLYQLFCYLRTVVPKTADFVLNDEYYDEDVSKKLVKRFDTDTFFERYNPYRKRARKKIRELTGIAVPDAEAVAAKVLYDRQKALYEANPSMVIRDLNRAIREQQREADIKEKEREEIRKQRRARR